ncbi:MAG TPA: response regulator [Candidatus Saccharimonadales bacterium]|nr:response regulator [Candidatus Saccharimonadales bacterium]
MKSRILIIEDEKPLREAFAFLLESEGYVVELAENGKVGLDKLAVFKPDLVLLDMLMPVMNGQEFLKEANLQAAPTIKTLMLSNLSDPITLDDAHVYGVTDSVLKADLSPAELAAKIKKLLAI